MRITTGVFALGLVLSLAACSDDPPATTPTTVVPTSTTSTTQATSSATTTTESATSTTSATTAPTSTTATTTSTSTKPTTTTAAPIVPDQSTPEAAMTSWLQAMTRGDATLLCQLQAIDGRPIAQMSEAVAICAKGLEPMLAQLKSMASEFVGISIKGATVTGTTATFDKATATPPLVKEVIVGFMAVKVEDKWYISKKA